MSNFHCPKCGAHAAQPISRELNDVLAIIRAHPRGITAASVHAALPAYRRTPNATMNLVRRLTDLSLVKRALRKQGRHTLYQPLK